MLQQCLYLYGSMLLSHLCTRKPESWTSVSGVSGKTGFVNLLFIRVKDIERAHPRTQKTSRTGGRKAGLDGWEMCIEDGLFRILNFFGASFQIGNEFWKKKNL